jgi:hypothetical protein
MLAVYLGLPLPRGPLIPPLRASVIHNHWAYDRRLHRVFYLVRDGRDVMTSLYFHRMRMITLGLGSSAFAAAMHARYQSALGADYDGRDSVGNMARFIELEMAQPREARQNWPAHVADWCLPRRTGVVTLTYEELLVDAVAALGRGLAPLLDGGVDRARLVDVVDRCSFETLTGRARGDADPLAFRRKGIAGDWRNHFNREAAEVFDHLAGDVLIDMGYEPDRGWVSSTQA